MSNNNSKLLLFYLNHPAHYHLFKNVINRFIGEGYRVKVAIVKKDVLERLVAQEKWDTINLFPEGRRHKNVPIIISALINLLKAEWRILKLALKIKPNILLGTEGTLAHIGFLLRIPSILFNEDDTSATPENYLFYPFATKVVLPDVCDINKWENKKEIYPGYHELAYLHPRYFQPRREFTETFNPDGKRYFILRLAELTASHDVGKTGIDNILALELISRLEAHGKVFITSERYLQPEFEQYRIHINPIHMPHALYFADMFIGDSQTMTAEAAVLGTPAIRFNDFVGKLGYLEDLEKKYELAFGIRTDQKKELIEKVNELLSTPRLKEHWQEKRSRMLIEKTDVNQLFIQIIEEEVWKGKKILEKM